MLDAAVQAGQNNLTIDKLAFDLSDQLSYERTVEARERASRDARTTAEQIARVSPLNTWTRGKAPGLAVGSESDQRESLLRQAYWVGIAGLGQRVAPPGRVMEACRCRILG